MITYDLCIGRFQPFHKGHEMVVNSMKNVPILAVVTGKKSDPHENPFTFLQRYEMIKRVFPHIIIISVKDANLKGILFHLKEEEKVVQVVYAGNDRIIRYRQIIDQINTENNSNIQVVETNRIVSATDIRNSLRSNEPSFFRKHMPEYLSTSQYYRKLQRFILKGQR